MSKKKSLGWGNVVFWVIFFWPVGIFKLLKKLNNNAELMSMTKAPTIAAWVLIVFGSVGLLGNLETLFSEFTVTIIVIAWIIGGVLILRKVRQTNAKADQYKKYLNVIVNVGERSIESIANALSVTYGQAQTDIQAMIDEGFLKGAYIHSGNQTVVLRQDIKNGESMNSATLIGSTAKTQSIVQQQSRSMRCTG